MKSFVNVWDVKSAEKRYVCLKFVNNETKMNMICVSSHRSIASLVVRKKEFPPKAFIFLEEINLYRQKQNNRFYLFDKSWYFPTKHVIFGFIAIVYLNNFKPFRDIYEDENYQVKIPRIWEFVDSY